MTIRTYASCPEHTAEMDYVQARAWLNKLLTERETTGSHPQLDTNIEAAQYRIEELALAAWEAAKERDDWMCMYMAGQQMSAALQQRRRGNVAATTYPPDVAR